MQTSHRRCRAICLEEERRKRVDLMRQANQADRGLKPFIAAPPEISLVWPLIIAVVLFTLCLNWLVWP